MAETVPAVGGAGSRKMAVPPPPGYTPPEETGEKEEGGGRERRIHERKSVQREAVATEVLPNGAIGLSWSCRTADVSRGGLALLSRRAAARGTKLFVRIMGANGKLSEPVYGTVMHMRYLADGDHQLGFAFQPTPAKKCIREWVEANKN